MIYIATLPPNLPKNAKPSPQHQTGLALLRHALILRGYPIPQDLSPLLRFGLRGKPQLQGIPIHFNISHTKRLVACAVELEPVGVDLEQIRRFSPALADRILGPGERELIDSLADRNSALTQLWTAKESYMKFTGLGLAQGIQETAFCQLGPFPRLRDGCCHFASTSLNGPDSQTYWLTLCCQGPSQLQLEYINL